jgi:hypothetical protein
VQTFLLFQQCQQQTTMMLSTTTSTESNNNTDATDNNDAITNYSNRISSPCHINGSCSDCISAEVLTVPVKTIIVPVQPYEMCSLDECHQRVRTNEISIFERKNSNSNDDDGTLNELSYDPCKVITKYRRSVASLDDDTTKQQQSSIRPISALYTTIQYLIHHIYIPISQNIQQQQHGQHQPPTKQNHIHHHTYCSYISTLNFMDDRIRAVQVDLIRQSSSPSSPSSSLFNDRSATRQQKLIQYNITKYYIITLYIVSDLSSIKTKERPTQSHTQYYYEPNFSYKALLSSLNSYWNIIDNECCSGIDIYVPNNNNHNNGNNNTEKSSNILSIDEDKIRRIDDEMLAYHILILFNQQITVVSTSSTSIQQQESLSTFWYTFTELYRKITKTSTLNMMLPHEHQLPFVQYVMKLIFTYCIHGQWQSALQMILIVPSSNYYNDKDNTYYFTNKEWERYLILIQCCMSSSIHYIRYQILQHMNCSIMKNEQLSLKEVARLLCYHRHSNSLHECYIFCHTLQLPMTYPENIHDPDNNHRIPITTKDIDPSILPYINVTFKVASIPPYNTIISDNNENNKIRTIDMDQYILHSISPLSAKHDILTHSSSLSLSPTSLSSSPSLPMTTTSIEGIVIPTTEWFYQRNIFS